MKKLLWRHSPLLFILCLFTCTAGFGQTKEETLQWLQDYGKEMMLLVHKRNDNHNNVKEVIRITKIDENGIMFEQEWENKTTDGTYYYQTNEARLDFKSLLVQDVETTKGKDGFVLKSQPEAIIWKSVKGNNGSVGKESTSSNITFPFSNKDEDVKRVLKAILHYAKLVGAKDLPKVKESTF